MNRLIASIILLMSFTFLTAQTSKEDTFKLTVGEEHPFGKPDPNMPEAFLDFEPMIGLCDCKSVQRNPDGTWKDTVNAVWGFKYIFNGQAVQDETWKDDGTYTSSIRQYNADSALWYVTYFSSSIASPAPPVWSGKKEGDKIILYREQKAPNGLDGHSRLTFYDMDESGYKWIGEWVGSNGQFIYPFWTLDCIRKETD